MSFLKLELNVKLTLSCTNALEEFRCEEILRFLMRKTPKLQLVKNKNG